MATSSDPNDPEIPSSSAPQPVAVVNTAAIARRVSRSLWWLAAIPLAILVLLGVLSVVADRRTDNENEQDRQYELAQRTRAQPFSGKGWEISQLYCRLERSIEASGRIKNTSSRPRSYAISVRMLDADGTLIGYGGASVPELAAGTSANWRDETTVVRFADGPPVDRCEVMAESSPAATDREDLRRDLTSAPNPLSAERAACIIDGLSARSFAFDGYLSPTDGEQQALEEVSASCAQAPPTSAPT